MKNHDEFLTFFSVGIVGLIIYELLTSGALNTAGKVSTTVPSLANPGALPATTTPNFTSLLTNFFSQSGQGSAAGIPFLNSPTISGAQIVPADQQINTDWPASAAPSDDGSVASNFLGDIMGD